MKRILCFGDSNTYGLIPKTSERYNDDIRWTGLLEKKVRNFGYRVIEEGLCGRTTMFEDPLRKGRAGAELLPIILETHKPVHKVVLMLGTNDCKTIYRASAEMIGKGISFLIEQIYREDQKIEIVLAAPILLADGVGEKEYDVEFDEESVRTSKKLKKIYSEIADRYGCKFIAASDVAVPSERDREHLDETGHLEFANAVYGVLSL